MMKALSVIYELIIFSNTMSCFVSRQSCDDHIICYVRASQFKLYMLLLVYVFMYENIVTMQNIPENNIQIYNHYKALWKLTFNM